MKKNIICLSLFLIVGCSSVSKNINQNEKINTDTNKIVYHYDNSGKVSKVEMIEIKQVAENNKVTISEKKSEAGNISGDIKYITIFGCISLCVIFLFVAIKKIFW